MEIVEYENMYRNERDHYFYVATHQLVLSLIEKYAPTPKKQLKILDAGCGTGLLAQKMSKMGRVEAIDFSPEAVKFSKRRKIKVQQASIEKLPFPDDSFDVVVSIDVLTAASIKNDQVALREFNRLLKPGGILIMRVSAYPWLKLIHDKHVHMRHRYERVELFNKLNKANFATEKLSFIHSFLFPLIIVRHLWENFIKPKESKSAVGKIHPLLNSFLTKLLLFEAKLFLKINLPFGLGLVSVSRKK